MKYPKPLTFSEISKKLGWRRFVLPLFGLKKLMKHNRSKIGYVDSRHLEWSIREIDYFDGLVIRIGAAMGGVFTLMGLLISYRGNSADVFTNMFVNCGILFLAIIAIKGITTDKILDKNCFGKTLLSPFNLDKTSPIVSDLMNVNIFEMEEKLLAAGYTEEKIINIGVSIYQINNALNASHIEVGLSKSGNQLLQELRNILLPVNSDKIIPYETNQYMIDSDLLTSLKSVTFAATTVDFNHVKK